jgi:hypothetical protein
LLLKFVFPADRSKYAVSKKLGMPSDSDPFRGQMLTSLTLEARAMAAAGDAYLTPLQHRYLEEMAKAPELGDIWKRIEKRCGKQSKFKIRYFIRDIVGYRSFADAADVWPDFLAHAKNTERVVRFLKGSGQLPPPMPQFVDLIPRLTEMATRSRQIGNFVHISRERKKGTRQHVLCMQLLSRTMQEYFKHWLDNEVAELVNIFFPKAFVTRASVRAARRRGRIKRAA